MTQPVRALLLDDDEDEYIIVAEVLSRGEPAIELEWASSLEEGLELVRKNSYDMFLVDYRLRGATGFDFLEKCRQENIFAVSYLVTAWPEGEMLDKAKNAGFHDMIDKYQLIDGSLKERLLQPLSSA